MLSGYSSRTSINIYFTEIAFYLSNCGSNEDGRLSDVSGKFRASFSTEALLNDRTDCLKCHHIVDVS